MEEVTLKIELVKDTAKLPTKANPTDACFDLYAAEGADLPSGDFDIIDTGLKMEIPEGWEVQIRGRSGLASKNIRVHPGTIDHLYRQTVKVIVYNDDLFGDDLYTINVGDRIAQMTMNRVPNITIIAGRVESSDRGGLGSTGV